MQNKVGVIDNSCFVSDLRGNVFNFSPLCMMLAVGLLYGLYYVEVCSLYAYFLDSSYHKWMLNFTEAFSTSIEMII